MGMSNFPNGFQNGVTIRGVPVNVPAPGNVYWVNNSSVLPYGGIAGSNGSKGTYLQPFSTIHYASTQCTAGRGDIIYVMPGHVETIATAAACDFAKAGVTVIGLGTGSTMPKFNFTVATGTVTVNASNVTIANMRFTASVTVVAIGLSLIAASLNTTVSGCIFDATVAGTDEFLIAINNAVGCDGTTIENCKIRQGLAGAAAAIKLVGASANVAITGCEITGDYSLACISGITNASTLAVIEKNTIMQGHSDNLNAVASIVLVAGTTGYVNDNIIFNDMATYAAMITGGDSMIYSRNVRSDEAGGGIVANLTSATVVISADA